jgi:hypothetical protein
MCRRLRRSAQGSMMVEVTLALIIFTMMVLLFAAVFPISVRAAHFSNYYAEATMIAQHKIDQLRYTGFSKIGDRANLSSLEIADSGLTSSAPPYTASFTNIDSLAVNGNVQGFFPSGSTGTISVVDYASAAGVSNPPPAGTVYRVTITITWTALGHAGSSYSASAFIVQMPHQ